MRISNQLMTKNAITDMSTNLDALYGLQRKLASGKAFQNASENPSAASQVLALRSSLRAGEDYLNTGQVTDQWMSANEYAFKGLIDTTTRVMNIAREGLSDTIGPEERQTMATEVAALLRHSVEVANTEQNGYKLFNGFQTDRPPFILNEAGGVFSITYNNTLPPGQAINQTIAPGQNIQVNFEGNDTIQPLLERMIDVYNALSAGTFDHTVLSNSINQVNDAMQIVSDARTANGARQRQVRTNNEFLEKTNLEIKGLISKKEDINMAEGITNLRNQETTYKAVLEVSQRAVSALNLFDYLS